MSWIEQINSSGHSVVFKSINIQGESKKGYGPCPCCGATQRGNADPRLPIGISRAGVGWYCFSCHKKGDLAELISQKICSKRCSDLSKHDIDNILDFTNSAGLTRPTKYKSNVKRVGAILKTKTDKAPVSESVQYDETYPFKWNDKLPKIYAAKLWESEGRPVLDWLTKHRKLSKEVIKDAMLGCLKINRHGREEYYLTIPLKDYDGTIVNMRFRTIPPNKKGYRVCPNRPMPLYGSDTLSSDRGKFVIVTEGELDVLALRTYGYKKDVVSGTTGATANWPDSWLDLLEPYQGFFLWYDTDKAGEAGSEKLAEKLGRFRSFRVKSQYNDCGEALSAGADPAYIQRALQNTEAYLSAGLRKASEYTEDIERLISNPKSLIGFTTGSKNLDAVVGGIAPGLWVVTGDTGHGKTSFVTWLLREQAMRNVPVMITSFEQRPVGTVQKLLRNQIGGDFTKVSREKREKALIELGKLPIHIMDHYGDVDANLVINTIRFSARRYNTKIALIDHLGFLTKSDNYKIDERIMIENVVRELATIAICDDITIILIAHPNNMSVSQQRRVKISDLKGASAIRQDAHVGLVIERHPMTAKRAYPATVVYADKVRSEFGANGGHCTLAYDPIACLYADKWTDTPAGKRGGKGKV